MEVLIVRHTHTPGHGGGITGAGWMSHNSPPRLLQSLAGGVILVTTFACGVEPLEDDDAESAADIPEAVQVVFERNCTAEGACHGSVDPAEGLSLVADNSGAIIGGPSAQSELPLVEIGSIDGSYVAIKLLPDEELPEGVSREGEQMPVGAIAEPADIAIIIGWIGGAPIKD